MSGGFCLGVSGRGRAGKDTFASLLTAHLAYRKIDSFAFAQALKEELDPLFRAFGGTAFETDTVKKARIRPILIAHGREKRLISGGRYWIERIEGRVKETLARGDIALVTDVRYNTHAADELAWIKSLGGKVIYIERIQEDGTVVPPASQEEEENDLALRTGADVMLSWPTTDAYRLFPLVERAARDLGLS